MRSKIASCRVMKRSSALILDVLLHNACSKLIQKRNNTENVIVASDELAQAMDMIERHFTEPGLSL